MVGTVILHLIEAVVGGVIVAGLIGLLSAAVFGR